MKYEILGSHVNEAMLHIPIQYYDSSDTDGGIWFNNSVYMKSLPKPIVDTL